MMAAKPAKHREEHVLVTVDGKGQKEIVLTEEMYSLGRGHDCDIRLQSQFASRHHATLYKRVSEGGDVYYRIVDGDAAGKASVNGLLINEHKVLFHDLKHGDKVIFGPQVSAAENLDAQLRIQEVERTIIQDQNCVFRGMRIAIGRSLDGTAGRY